MELTEHKKRLEYIEKRKKDYIKSLPEFNADIFKAVT
jgi:hypothetical protein